MNSQLNLIAACLLAAGAVSASAADWPQYRGPNLDGISKETAIATKWPAGGPKVVWKTTTQNGFSSFTVAGGRAYTIVTREVQGAPQEVVVAFDANTGKELWFQAIGIAKYDGGGDSGAPDNKGGDGARSTPTVDGGKVYAISANLGLACFDAASGKKLWGRDILKDHGGEMIRWKNAASPVIDGNLIFMAGGGPKQALLGIDKLTGRTVWKAHDDKMTHSTPTVATILGTRQVIFFTQTGLVAVAPANGGELWRYNFEYKTSTAISPVVCGDIVYCSAGYGVGGGAAKLAIVNKKFVAKEIYRIPGDKQIANHWSTPVFKDGYLYGMFQFKEYGAGPLKCVEAATGKVVWEKPGFGPGNITMVGGKILALSDAGEIVLAEATPKAYQEISRAKVLTGKCWSTPIVSDGRIYARSTKEAVCLDVSVKAAAR
ncbi:MAG: PQQ-binding-like beta-propeller repeat protein [Verrucomicrobia bacterium]|nr:PQQ-binding-like beta-propeller repeat protein [Verrucomicrobiota bacterium]